MVTSAFSTAGIEGEKPLNLFYKDRRYSLQQGAPAYTFGRDPQCNQQIDSSLVSRIHAKIENRRGKFVLIDESTNGIYLKLDNKNPVFLRREEMVLQGHGIISFGETLDKNEANLIHFSQ